MKLVKRILTTLFLLACTGAAGTCTVIQYQSHHEFANHSDRVNATVVEYLPFDIEMRTRHRAPSVRIHKHVIEFGSRSAILGVDEVKLAVGTKVDILYDTRDPSRVALYHESRTHAWGLWDWTWRIGGTLLLFLAVLGTWLGDED